MLEKEGFQTDGNEPIIQSFGNAKEAVIPAVMNGKPIGGIGEDAFAGIGLTSVVISSDVTLEDNAIDNDFAAFYNGNGKKREPIRLPMGSGLMRRGKNAL
jgi:hypothetical protein